MGDYFLINLIIGILAGILAGLFGIGGGVVIVPALIFLSGFTLIQANGTSLVVLLLPVGILAVISYYREKLIDIKASGYLAIGLFLGVAFGSLIAINLPTNLLKTFYGIFLLYVSWNFMKPVELFQRKILKIEPKPVIINEKPVKKNLPYIFLIIVGIFAGVLSGMFGIGGGLVIVPILIGFLKFDTKKAVGTSLGALLLPVGLPGVIIYRQAEHINYMYALPVAIGVLIGALIGARISISLSSKLVKRIYSVFLLIMGIYFIFRGIM